MIRVVWFALLTLAALSLVASAAFSQGKQDPGASISPDSSLKLCKILYSQNCSGCHGEKGQGTVGPNLTDKYWLHGGSTKSIARTVKEGVPGKGMISWDAVLSPADIQRVAEYLAVFQGTDPPKAKKPEGELYEDRRN